MTEEPAGPTVDDPEDLLSWPPPGLARIQGDLWVAVRKMGTAGFVLVAPLLAALSLPDAGEGLGPYGDAWWIVIVTTLAGFGLFVDALVMCVRLLTRARAAIARGYSTRLIGLVATDEARTGGFLLQGAHEFSTVPPEVRLVLSRVRILSGVVHLASMCWLTIGFGLCLLLAARGVLSPAGLAAWTLVPTALLWAAGLVLRAVDSSLTRRARKEWHRHPWSEDLVREEVADWTAGAEERGLRLRVPALRRGWLTAAILVLIGGSVVGIIPTVTLVPASSMGAILSAVTGWRYASTVRRAAIAELYRDYRLEPDPGVDTEEAGVLLRSITSVGRAAAGTGLRAATRTHDAEWFPEPAPEGWQGYVAPLWSDSVWVHADRGFSPELRTYLERVAAHPAHEDFSRLARAPALDLLASYYEGPFDASVTMYEIEIPRFSGLRLGANAHLAAAALRSADGRHDEAQRMVREVVSLGFLLQDDSPFLIGTLVGSTMIHVGGDALHHVMRRAGDEVGAASVLAARRAGDRVVSLVRNGPAGAAPGNEAYLEGARALAADSTALRGLRWEMLHMTAVLAPCRNVRSIVFGPGPEYDAWLSEVRSTLVRSPAEADFFAVAARGLELEGTRAGPLARALAASMGGGEAPSRCARVIGTVRSMM